MRRSMSSLWWRDSNQTASGKPGAVQGPVGCMSEYPHVGCETEHETDRGPLCPEKSALPWNTARRYGGSQKRVIIEDWRRDYYMLRRPTADSGAIS